MNFFHFPPLESLSPSFPSISPSVRNIFLCYSTFLEVFSVLSLSVFSSSLQYVCLYLCPCELYILSTLPHTPFHLSLSLDTSASTFTPASFLSSSFFTCLPRTSLPLPFLRLGPYFCCSFLPFSYCVMRPYLSHSVVFSNFWWMDFLVIISLFISLDLFTYFSLCQSLSRERWVEVVTGGSTISMQSHGAVTLPSLIELAAKYRHCWGSASLLGWNEGGMRGWRDRYTYTHTDTPVLQNREYDKYNTT